MISQPLLPTFERFLDRIVEKMTPEEILAFEVSEDEQDYVQELVEHNSEGTLTPEEKSHLDQMVEFDLLVGVLKAKALKVMRQS
jgi:hypothetical protein